MNTSIKRRVDKLELIRPAFRKCPSYGDIDPATRTGLFRQGLVLDQSDGRHACWCKWCNRSFSAVVSRGDHGECIVSDVTPCAFEV